MAKFTEFQTPLGAKGNVLSPSTWLQMIIGVLVFLVTLGIGQHIFQKATRRLPQAQLEPFVAQPPAPSSSGPAEENFTG